jgi:cytochrome b
VSAQPDTVPAWDLPTRIFHWLLVALVVAAWVSYEFSSEIGDRTMIWHRWNGLAILTLLIWRVIWGFVGSSTARFANFVRTPSQAIAYAQSLLSGAPRRYLGHNPAGAFMVLALIGALALDAGLGLFAVDDNDLVGGPLHRLVGEEANKWATRWHERIFDWVLIPLVLIHIAANVLYGVMKKEPLIPAMMTGAKPAADYADAPRIEEVSHPMWRALLCFIAAKVTLFGTMLAAGGRIF